MTAITRRTGRVFFVGALLVAAAAGRARADAPPNYSVLAVGINTYKSNEIGGLRGAVNDARSIVELFRGQGSRAKVQELLDRDATHANAVAALARLEAGIEPGEVVVLFLSGHGGRQADEWEFACHDFIPPPPGPHPPGASLSGTWLLGVAERLVKRGHLVILAIDACHAGQVARTSRAERLLLTRDPSGGGLVLLASCVPTQTSKDAPDNGLFTKALLEALRGRADLDENGAVTLKEVELYLPWRMRRLTRAVPKYPGIEWPEQDYLCASSALVPDSLAIARSNGLKPLMPSDATPMVKPFLGLREDHSRIPAGVWREVRTYPKADGEAARSVFLLAVRADGGYVAYFQDPSGGEQQNPGRYQGASLGFMATLSYANGYDSIMVKGVDADGLEVQVFPSGSFQDQASTFLLRRVEGAEPGP